MQLPLRDFSQIISALKQRSTASAAAEARRSPRTIISACIDIHIICNGKVLRSLTALTRDISLRGIALIQSVDLPIGQDVIVTLPRSAVPLRALAKVTRSQTLAEGIFAAGLEFVAILEKSAPASAPPPGDAPAAKVA